ncbi:MAG: aminoacyl-tRNA hydrolase [Phycisphaeraceae bacterium]|nr:aminoacyl-tRNA hydrolase [Phycisphaeraceae bacterium]MCB9848277.1 aminoacyl-tRNA hydrolase [Phycisphaeraceae bacterium]
MKLIVGLGNPGRDYDRTRHNAGFMAVDRLARRHAAGAIARGQFHAMTLEAAIPGAGKCLLIKPNTYMNRSGLAVGEAVRFYKCSPVEDVLIIVDEVALPVGSIRLRAGGSAGGHNGLADIERALGTSDYPRLRIGVGEPEFAARRDHVLGRFTDEESTALEPALERACDAAERWAAEGVIKAMNEFNTRAASGWGKPAGDTADDSDNPKN